MLRDVSRRPFLLLLLLLLVLIAALPAAAGIERWTAFGPGGGPVLCLAADPGTPGTFYAGSSVGLFKSTDSTRSWRWSGHGLPAGPPADLAVDPERTETVYAAYSAGLFRSMDGGAGWSLVLSYGPTARISLALGPEHTVFVAAEALYRSADGGDTWSEVLAPAGGLDVVRVDSSSPGAVYAAAFRYQWPLFKSVDGGQTWSLLARAPWNDLVSAGALALAPSRPSTLYLAVGKTLYRSDDGGARWSTHGLLDFEPRVLAVDPASPAILYTAATRAGGPGGVLMSRDGGRRWRRIDEGLPAGSPGVPPAVLSMVHDPFAPGMLYAGTALDGVFRLDTGEPEGRWQAELQRGLTGLRVRRLGFDPANPRTVYIVGESRPPLVSRDGGQSWGPLAPALEGFGQVPEAAFDPTEPSALYALAGGFLWRSFNGGVTWSRRGQVPAGFESGTLAFAGKRRILLGGGGMALSTDGGRTWSHTLSDRTQEEDEAVPFRWVQELMSAARDAGTFYARVWESHLETGVHQRLYRSRDGGATWRLLLADCEALALDPTRPKALYALHDRVLWQSVDRGEHWLRAGRFNDNAASLLVDPAAPAVLYAATYRGVLRSTDGGAHWSAVNAGLARQLRLEIAAVVAHPTDPHRIFALPVGGGIFEARFEPR